MGFTNRFRGRSAFQSLSLLAGGFLDTASGVAGSLQGCVKIPVTVTAIANTDITAAIPPGATILSATFYTTTAFTAGTDITAQVGSAATGAQYVAAISVKALGIVAMTLVNAGAAGLASMPALASGKNIFVRLVQSGTPTAVGAGVLVIEYA